MSLARRSIGATRQSGKIAIVGSEVGIRAAESRKRNPVPESLSVTFLVRLVLVALAASLGVAGEAGDRPIVIGAIYNLTGGQQDLDTPSSRGARLAVDLANAGKGVLGRQVSHDL